MTAPSRHVLSEEREWELRRDLAAVFGARYYVRDGLAGGITVSALAAVSA